MISSIRFKQTVFLILYVFYTVRVKLCFFCTRINTKSPHMNLSAHRTVMLNYDRWKKHTAD